MKEFYAILHLYGIKQTSSWHICANPVDSSKFQKTKGHCAQALNYCRIRKNKSIGSSMRSYYLVVVGEVVVGHSDSRGSHDGIDQAVGAVRQRAVVHPNVAGAEDGHSIAVGNGAPPVVAGRAAHHGVPCGLAVVDVEPVDDDVGDILDGDAGAVGDVHVGAASVDGLEAVHDELLLERDHHIPLEDDPERLVLDHGVAEGALARVDGVVVARISDHVDLAVAATDGVAAEADAAVSQALAVLVPVRVAAPAVVHRVASAAVVVAKHPSVQRHVHASVHQGQ